ncbi:MAG: DUF2232 domain-containing protein [Christensenellaceae bacterium]
MPESSTGKQRNPFWKYLLVSAGVFILGALVPAFMPVCFLVVPFPLVISAVRCGKAWALLILGVLVVLGLLFYLPAVALFGILYFAAVTYVLSYIIRKKLSFRESVQYSCFLVFGMVLLMEVLVYAANGMTLAELLTQNVEGLYKENIAEITQMFNALNDAATTEEQALGTLTAGLFESMRQTLLTLETAAISVLGLLNYVVPRAVLRKQGVDVGNVPGFSMFALPKYFGLVSFVIVVVVFVGGNAGILAFEYIGTIVMTFFGIAYYIQGVAFFEWFLRKKIASPPVRVLIYVVSSLLLWIAYILAGIFEQAAKLRKRQEQGELP